MNLYEQLEEEACKDGIEVIDYDFKSQNIKGLYCNGVIGINKKAIRTTTERACVLAEELGHYHTTVGDIIDLSDARARKQERQARLWGYNKKIGLQGLIRAYEHGCHDRYEIADYLEVTEKYLQECINCYRDKYGICIGYGDYIVFFIPNLAVMETV